MASNSERITMYIDRNITTNARVKQLKVIGRVNMSNLVSELLTKWINENGGFEDMTPRRGAVSDSYGDENEVVR